MPKNPKPTSGDERVEEQEELDLEEQEEDVELDDESVFRDASGVDLAEEEVEQEEVEDDELFKPVRDEKEVAKAKQIISKFILASPVAVMAKERVAHGLALDMRNLAELQDLLSMIIDVDVVQYQKNIKEFDEAYERYRDNLRKKEENLSELRELREVGAAREVIAPLIEVKNRLADEGIELGKRLERLEIERNALESHYKANYKKDYLQTNKAVINALARRLGVPKEEALDAARNEVGRLTAELEHVSEHEKARASALFERAFQTNVRVAKAEHSLKKSQERVNAKGEELEQVAPAAMASIGKDAVIEEITELGITLERVSTREMTSFYQGMNAKMQKEFKNAFDVLSAVISPRSASADIKKKFDQHKDQVIELLRMFMEKQEILEVSEIRQRSEHCNDESMDSLLRLVLESYNPARPNEFEPEVLAAKLRFSRHESNGIFAELLRLSDDPSKIPVRDKKIAGFFYGISESHSMQVLIYAWQVMQVHQGIDLAQSASIPYQEKLKLHEAGPVMLRNIGFVLQSEVDGNDRVRFLSQVSSKNGIARDDIDEFGEYAKNMDLESAQTLAEFGRKMVFTHDENRHGNMFYKLGLLMYKLVFGDPDRVRETALTAIQEVVEEAHMLTEKVAIYNEKSTGDILKEVLAIKGNVPDDKRAEYMSLFPILAERFEGLSSKTELEGADKVEIRQIRQLWKSLQSKMGIEVDIESQDVYAKYFNSNPRRMARNLQYACENEDVRGIFAKEGDDKFVASIGSNFPYMSLDLAISTRKLAEIMNERKEIADEKGIDQSRGRVSWSEFVDATFNAASFLVGERITPDELAKHAGEIHAAIAGLKEAAQPGIER